MEPPSTITTSPGPGALPPSSSASHQQQQHHRSATASMECEEQRQLPTDGAVGDENVNANSMQHEHQPVVAVPPARSATPAPSSHSSGIPSVPRVPSSSSLSTLTGGGTSTAAAANNGGNANNANATTAGGKKKKKGGGGKQQIQQQQQYQSPLPPPPPTHNSGGNPPQGQYVPNGKGALPPPPPPPPFPPGSNAPPPNNDAGGVMTIDGEMQQLGPPPDVYAMPIRKRSVSTHSASERGVAGLIEDLAKIDQEEQEKERKRQAKEQKRAQKALLKQQQRQEQQNQLQRESASSSPYGPHVGGNWQHPHAQCSIVNHTPPMSYGDDFQQQPQREPQQKQQEVHPQQQPEQPPLGFAMERFLSNAPGVPKQTQINPSNNSAGVTDKLTDGSILPPPPIPQNNSYILVNTSDPRSGGLPVAFGSGKGDQDESDASSLLSDLIAQEDDGECGSVQLGDVVIHPVTRTGSFRANKSQQSTGVSGQNEPQEQIHLQPPLPPTANAPGSMNNSAPVAGGNPNVDVLSRDRAQSFASAVTSHSDFGDANEGVGGAVVQPSPQRPPSNPRPKKKGAGAGAGKASKKNKRDGKKKSNNGGNAESCGGAKTENGGRKSPSAQVIMVDDFDYDKYAPAPPPPPPPHPPKQEQVGTVNAHSAVKEQPQERPLQDVDHSFHHYYHHMPPYHHEAQQGQQQQMGAPSFQPQQHAQPAYAPVVNHPAVSPSSHHHHIQPPVYGSTGEVDGSFQRQQGYSQEGAYQNFHPHPPMQHFQYSSVPQHQPVGEDNSKNIHPGGSNVVTCSAGAEDPESLVPLVVHTNNAGGTVVNSREAPTMFSQSTTTGSRQILAEKSRTNPQHLRHSLLRVESFASAVESVFSSVRSVSTADLEADMNDSEKYLASGMLSRAFPERFFALIVTLAVEIPVLLMISGGSDRLCGILGRKRYQLLMAFLPLSSAISGNCGLQASTLTTRAISHLHVTKGSYFKWLFKEMGASLFLGLGMGIVLGFVAFQASGNDIVFGATIFVGNVLSILTAGFTGTMAPLIFTFIFHRDSGKWGGPLETAIQDIVGSFAMVILSYRLLIWFGPSAVDPSDYCGAQEAM